MDKIICLGKNYLEHAKELGDKVPEKPVIFLKPPSTLCQISKSGAHAVITLPGRARDCELHHEIEIVLRIGRDGENIEMADALSYVDSVTIGLDMTLRDVQVKLKNEGHPWEICKVFPDSAIVGPFVRLCDFPDWDKIDFSLAVNSQKRQSGGVREMMMSPVQAICYASSFFKLCAGDLLFMGTPPGVGRIFPGNRADLVWNSLSYSVEWK
ncbi:MAG: fumarylacetoacetate hydrolase family protein [Oligoflexales bacterium]|nr:fumarylacetoacetate hydrolase family protein [Oligoflexales bacterium]